MNYTHFIFASYVFLLVCGAIWFYGRVMRAESKKDKSGYEKEQRLFVMYQNVEDMLDGFEGYAEEAKSAIDERLKQVESLIDSLRRDLADQRELQKREEPKAAPPREEQPVMTETQPAPVASQPDIPPPALEPARQESAPVPEPVIRAEEEKPHKREIKPQERPKPKTPELIQQYAEQGMDEEEIAKALGISKREVSLIMEIKKISV